MGDRAASSARAVSALEEARAQIEEESPNAFDEARESIRESIRQRKEEQQRRSSIVEQARMEAEAEVTGNDGVTHQVGKQSRGPNGRKVVPDDGSFPPTGSKLGSINESEKTAGARSSSNTTGPVMVTGTTKSKARNCEEAPAQVLGPQSSNLRHQGSLRRLPSLPGIVRVRGFAQQMRSSTFGDVATKLNQQKARNLDRIPARLATTQRDYTSYQLTKANSKLGVNGAVQKTAGEKKRGSRLISQAALWQSYFIEKVRISTFAKPGVLHPHSTMVLRWEMFMALLIVYVAFVTPFQIAFLATELNALFVCDCIVDICFLVDIVRLFNTAYFDNEGKLETRTGMIRGQYVRSFFLIDVAAILPLDAIELASGQGGGLPPTRILRLLRVLRILRAIRMLRSVRGTSFITKIQDRFEVSEGKRVIVLGVGVMLIITHWFGCAIAFAAQTENMEITTAVDGPDGAGSHPSTRYAYSDHPSSWIEAHLPADASLYDKFVASLYFAMQTLTTIGMGDMTMVTSTERLVHLVLSFGATCFLLWIIALAIRSNESDDPAYAEYRSNWNHLAWFTREMRSKGCELPQSTVEQIRTFFREQRQIQHVRYGMHLLHRVSPSLQVQIAFYVFADFVNVPFFCAEDLHERREFIGKLSLHVRSRLWCPGEVVISYGSIIDAIYVIDSGFAAFYASNYTCFPAALGGNKNGASGQKHSLSSGGGFSTSIRIFHGHGSWFPPEGDFLLSRRFGHAVRAVKTHLSCMTITRHAVARILIDADRFPQTRRLMTSCKVATAFRRSFLRYASMISLTRRSPAVGGDEGGEGEIDASIAKATAEYVREGNLNHQLDWLEEMLRTGRSKAEVQLRYCIVSCPENGLDEKGKYTCPVMRRAAELSKGHSNVSLAFDWAGSSNVRDQDKELWDQIFTKKRRARKESMNDEQIKEALAKVEPESTADSAAESAEKTTWKRRQWSLAGRRKSSIADDQDDGTTLCQKWTKVMGALSESDQLDRETVTALREKAAGYIRQIEAIVTKTRWWEVYTGQLRGGVMSAAQQSGVKTVYLVAIEGGPISQVEAMHLPQRKKELQTDLERMSTGSQVQLEIVKFERWQEFEKKFLSKQTKSTGSPALRGRKPTSGSLAAKKSLQETSGSIGAANGADNGAGAVGGASTGAQPESAATVALLQQVLARLDASDAAVRGVCKRLDQLDAKFDRLAGTTGEVLVAAHAIEDMVANPLVR